MYQTARDQTPVKLNHMNPKMMIDSVIKPHDQRHQVKSLKKGSSSLEKLVYDPQSGPPDGSKSPVKLPSMKPQVSNSHIPLNLSK